MVCGFLASFQFSPDSYVCRARRSFADHRNFNGALAPAYLVPIDEIYITELAEVQSSVFHLDALGTPEEAGAQMGVGVQAGPGSGLALSLIHILCGHEGAWNKGRDSAGEIICP